MKVDTAVNRKALTITTINLARNGERRFGTAAKVERAIPVVNSELMSRTPSEPRISWANAMPEVGMVTAMSPPCAAMAAAASGSLAACSANCPVPQAESAAKPTITNAVEARRISVDNSVRNLMNSEFSTRWKAGPGPTELRMDLRSKVVVLMSISLRPEREKRPGGDVRVVFHLVLGQLHVSLFETCLERGQLVDHDLVVQGSPGDSAR